MRISVFCRRFLCCLLICMALISVSYASTVDLSAMTNEEIIALLGQVNQEIVSRGIQKSASLPAGKYVGGRDLPVGAYILTCKTDENHHGIVWLSAAGDDLNNQYPSILYEHISYNKEEQFRISIEEGGILNLPFSATLTISPALLFQ